ncbi:MAG: hypothetical protein ACRDQ7_27460, partial [Haloechinothrix sp.]
AGAGAISLGSLADEPWIAPHSDAALRAVLEQVCGIAGFEPRLDYTSDELRPIVGTRPSRHRVGRRARGRRAEPSGGLGGGCAARGRR